MKDWFFKTRYNRVDVMIIIVITEIVVAILGHVHLNWS